MLLSTVVNEKLIIHIDMKIKNLVLALQYLIQLSKLTTYNEL